MTNPTPHTRPPPNQPANQPAITPDTQGNPQLNIRLAFALGLFFSVLQFSYFFLLEAYVSSRAVSFFFALFFWLCGFLIGLNQRRIKSLAVLVVLSVVCYYLASILVQQYPYTYSMFAVVGVALLLSGIAPGYYFPWAKRRFTRVKSLFLHENNGFILGIVITLFAAIFAGSALLSWGPALALGVAALATIGARTSPVSAEQISASPFIPTLLGLYFGVLQVALYLSIQVFYTASFIGYFLIVVAWMVGVVWGLRFSRLSLQAALLASLASYAILLASIALLAPYDALLPWIGFWTAVVGLPVGLLFKNWRARLNSHALFFHENNGFVIGYAVSILAFVQWGTGFLYWGPLLGFALVALGTGDDKQTSNPLSVLLFAALLIPLSWLSGSVSVALALVVAFILLAFALPKRNQTPAIASPTSSTALGSSQPWPAMSDGSLRFTLIAAGACLLLLQYLISREFSAVLAASELAILIVALAYFCGFSLGYGLLNRLSLKWAQAIAVTMFFLHVAILLFVKPIAGAFIQSGYGWEVLLGLLFITAFGTSAFYSMLLPRIIDARGADSLPQAYSWDLAGAIAGVVIMIGLVQWWPAAILPTYLLLMTAIIGLMLSASRFSHSFFAFGLLCTALIGWYQEPLMIAATESYYQSRGYDHAKLRYSRQSLYHSIDVIETFEDEAQTLATRRASFLNGVRYFQYRNTSAGLSGETGLSEFTYFLAELPAKYQYQRKKRLLRVLILGAGSMYSLQRVRHFSTKTTLVEIDSLVVDSARKAWNDINHLDELNPQQVEIVIDDAKHYLMTTDEKFDLIVMDISAPYYLGTSLLHNREFFRLVKTRLKADGIFAESTQSRPRRNQPNSMSMRILAAVDEVFPYWNVVDTRGKSNGSHGYVYASKRKILQTRQWRKLLKQDQHAQDVTVFGRDREYFRLHRVTPFSLENMDSLLSSNRQRIKNRLRLNRSHKDSALATAGTAVYQILLSLPKWPILLWAMFTSLIVILLFAPLRTRIDNAIKPPR